MTQFQYFCWVNSSMKCRSIQLIFRMKTDQSGFNEVGRCFTVQSQKCSIRMPSHEPQCNPVRIRVQRLTEIVDCDSWLKYLSVSVSLSLCISQTTTRKTSRHKPHSASHITYDMKLFFCLFSIITGKLCCYVGSVSGVSREEVLQKFY